jgi:23S rRNA (adenine2503-C2)-methyltransferase
MEKKNIIGISLNEMISFNAENEIPKYIASETLKWIYQRNATDFDQMTNISKNDREKLKNTFEIDLNPPVKVQISKDGTKKYLYASLKKSYIETAYIPEDKRKTLCVSSQVGCKMGCRFCMTARQGLQGQLSSGDIINQVLSLPEKNYLTNLVFMGMGEPFDNTEEVLKSLEILTAGYGLQFSPKRINVSTIGLVPGMIRFIEETECNLAISLHSPFNEERKKLMPVQRLHPIEEIIELLKSYNFKKQRRLSFEYILFNNVNDSEKHVKQLARLLNGLKCRINLLNFHQIPGSSLEGSSHKRMIEFQQKLKAKGIITTIRKSRGEDIMAACGLLSTGEKMKKRTIGSL